MTDLFAVLMAIAVLSAAAYAGAWILDVREVRKLARYAQLAVRKTGRLDQRP